MRKHTLPILLAGITLTIAISLQAQNAQFSRHISNHEIQTFAQDAQGYIWMGTARGLNRYNGTSYTTFYAGSGDFDLHSNNILSLYQDSDGRLWTGTECGLGYYENGRFHQFANAVFNPTSQILELDKEKIVAIGLNGLISFRKEDINTAVDRFMDNGTSRLNNATISSIGEVWLARNSADSCYLSILDSHLRRIEEHFLGMHQNVLSIVKRPGRTLWVATADDILTFDEYSRNQRPTPAALKKLVHQEQILFLQPYQENSLLIGLAGLGLFSFDIDSEAVTQLVPEQHLDAQNYVCFVDRDNNIWLSDKESDVLFYAYNRPYAHFSPGENPLLNGRISHLAFDREGYLWMRSGSRLCSMDPSSGKILWISPSPTASSGLLIDSHGNLDCISDSKRAVEQYRLSGGKASLIRSIPLKGDAFSISEDTEGKLWLSLSRQLAIIGPDGKPEYISGPERIPFTMILGDPSTKRVFLFTVKDGLYEILPEGSFRQIGDKSLASSDIVMVARDGTLWCGTYNDGLIRYNERDGSLEHFDETSGMAATGIKSLLEDAEGNIWVSTSEHISKYDAGTRTFSTFHDDRFSGGRFYDLVSAAAGPDGRLFFGGTGGITVIDPSAAVSSRKETALQFEYLAVNGEQFPSGAPALDLSWKENSLDFRFSGIDFEAGSLLNYSYMLEGYDKDWQYRSSDVEAAYSQVPAGRYVFRARVREQNGQWSPQELRLPITIHPAPWASWWARLLYFLMSAGLLVGGIWFFLRLRAQRSKLAIAQQREEMKQQHIDFVTNISHEFRTPLSMIYAPVKELSKHSLPEEDKRLVSTIARNAEHLRGLAEQILSTQGGRQENEALHIRQNDLVSVVRSMAGNFAYAAQEKGQELKVDVPESMIAWFDTEKVSKILGNLLSNAIKYTQEGGQITVCLMKEDNHACIRVVDDGIGIAEDKRDRIFERYERLGAESTGVIGSGIGLHYARSLALLHKGALEFRPNEPAGSIFTLTLPVNRAAYDEAQVDETAYIPPAEVTLEDTGEKDGTLLIAEDSDEIRYFLRDLFAPHYRVILAPDGQEAEENLKLALPDLVLSDVIMPRKTGYALCAAIKENPQWCHIPVVLLTAKADAGSNIEGMRAGADAYIPKPFDPDVLMAAVESQLRNRRLLQSRVLNLTSTTLQEPEKAEEAHLNASDKALLEKVYAWMDAHLDDETTGVQDLAQELGMSYSSLYAKLKALTGKTPQAFMMHYRMNIAMELLKEGELNVSEVAYKVGSSSPSTFSREFKKHFGFPPSQVQ